MGNKREGLTAKQERFARNLFQGMSERVAYLDAGYSNKQKIETIDRNAFELANNNKIIARLAELNKAAEDASVATVLERKQVLTKMIRADLKTPDTTIATKVKTKITKDGNKIVDIEYPNKVTAIDALNKMDGMYQPEKSGDTYIQNNTYVEVIIGAREKLESAITRIASRARAIECDSDTD